MPLDEMINTILDSNKPKLRVKRYDQKMINDCSSHETGLAIGYYSIFLKFLIESE
jgi:hypothetical protein